MKNLFSKAHISTLIIFLSIMLIVKIVYFVVLLLWLPSKGINYSQEKQVNALFYRLKLSPNKAPPPRVVPKKQVVKKVLGNIREIKLIAIYNALDSTVVTIEYKGKTKVLSKDENVNGFVLEGAGEDYANFSKQGKMYKVQLQALKESKKHIRPIRRPSSLAKKPSTEVIGEVIDAGDHKIVEKSLLTHFANNLDEVNKNIGIAEVKDKNGLKGFRISFIRRGSPFAQLGVKRGDIIKTINGQKINSYNAAFSVYKNIGNIENLSMVIERGNEEMELEYEVN
jgi:general secretion pathway protein C